MNYSEIKLFDIANGPGVRTSLFVSGCRNKCPECFNPETWDFGYGQPFLDKTIDYILETLDSPNIAGLSILGGEPLEPENQNNILKLVKMVKEKYPNKTIWLWTGFKFVDIINNLHCRACTSITRLILSYIDVMVDEPFDISKKELLLRFRGSSNQNIIDINESRQHYWRKVLWKDDPIFDTHEWPTDILDPDKFPKANPA